MADEMPSVLVDRQGAVVTITLNRPERRNGVTVEMCEALYDAVREVAASDARAVILRGAGTDFCVGADILLPQDGESAPETLESLGLIHHSATLLHTMPQVTIASIDGGCAGAGMGWAAACDLRFASHRARFSTAFLTVGVSGDMGLAWSLTRILGGAKARELLLFPDKINAEQALALGFVTRLFSSEEIHMQARTLADELCTREPFALRMTKANCLSAEELGLAEYIDIETARQVHCTNRPDMGNRMAAAYRQAQQHRS